MAHAVKHRSSGSFVARIGAATVAGLLATALIAGAPSALAQDLGIKAAPQKGAVAIVGGTVHPVSGPSGVGTVVFEGGLIQAVALGEDAKKVVIPAGATVVDAAGKHVYPGLIAPYTQLGLTEIESVASTRIDLSETGGITPEVRAGSAVNPDSTLIPVTRSAGILTAGIFPIGGTVSGQGSVIRLDGWTVVDMQVSNSCGLMLNWPRVRPISAWWMDRSEDDQKKEIEESLARIRDLFDKAKAYRALHAAEPSALRDLRLEVVARTLPADSMPGEGAGTSGAPVANGTKDLGRDLAGMADTRLPVFIQAGEADQIASAVTFGASLGLKMVIVGGREADRCAPLLLEHNVPVIVMGNHNFPKREDSGYDESLTLPARLKAAGIRFAMASGEDTSHERLLGSVAGWAAGFGLSREDALRSVTLSAAEVLGVSDLLGSLDVGKRATLIVTDGDPLEIRTKVEIAYVDGRQIDLSNKQTELMKKYEERYKQQAK